MELAFRLNSCSGEPAARGAVARDRGRARAERVSIPVLVNLRLGGEGGRRVHELQGVSIPVLVNLRLGLPPGRTARARRDAVSIPVLVNLRLGRAAAKEAQAVTIVSQFLFW